jgi:hypothetical protein
MGITDKALERVFPYVERKAGSAVVVKRAERLVTDDFQSKLLGDSLDGEVAKLL